MLNSPLHGHDAICSEYAHPDQTLPNCMHILCSKAMTFLFVGLHCTFMNFKVRQSGKKIKIEPGSKLDYFHQAELFTSVLHYVLCTFLTQNMNQCLNLVIKSQLLYKFYPYTELVNDFHIVRLSFVDHLNFF